MGILTGDVERVQDQAAALIECQSFLQDRYFRHCTPSDTFQALALKTGTIMLSKLSLIIQCPLFREGRSETVSVDMRGLLFDLSCEIIISSHEVNQDPQTVAWSWLLQTYVHWHPVAYLLSEICAGLQGEKLSKAWDTVNIGMADYHGLSDKRNENIWRPLRGLFERARSVTHEGTFANTTHRIPGLFAGVFDSEAARIPTPDDILDQETYSAMPQDSLMHNSAGQDSIWSFNDYTIQHTFDPQWWSGQVMDSNTAPQT